jgi:hypothetical protein
MDFQTAILADVHDMLAPITNLFDIALNLSASSKTFLESVLQMKKIKAKS